MGGLVSCTTRAVRAKKGPVEARMTLNISVPTTAVDLKPRITVIGVGGAGGNAVNNMIRSNLEGVEFLIANTDAQALGQSLCEQHIQLGRHITQGLGAGSRPEIGRAAAEEALDEILGEIENANMLFITAGMGGGTGTGAAPVIAQAAREAGLLTVGVITKPFHFEGIHRMRLAENGIQELTEHVDTLIIIPNQNLFRVANEKTTFADAFKMADDVLEQGVRGVTDLMVMPGLINLDFADIRSVMTEMGKAMMGTGEAEGDSRAIASAEAAISNPLLDDVSMKGARGVLINITGGMDLTLFEVDEAVNRVRDEVDPEANIIFGSTFNEGLEGRMRVSVVATGMDAEIAAAGHAMNLAAAQPRKPRVTKPVEPEIRDEVAAVAAHESVVEEAPVPETVEAGPVVGESQEDASLEGGLFDEDGFDQISVEGELDVEEPTNEEPIFEESELEVPQIPISRVPQPPRQDPEMAPQPAAAMQAEEKRSEDAMPGEDDSFIVPAPIAAEEEDEAPQPLSPAPDAARPDPFAAAAMTNATPPRVAESGPLPFARKAAQSLFSKVTGASTPETDGRSTPPLATEMRTTQSAQPVLEEEVLPEPPVAESTPREPRLAEPAAKQEARPVAQPQPAPTTADEVDQTPLPRSARQAARKQPEQAAARPQDQAKLDLDPKEKVGQSQADEDLLDIPAFLRRQAN